MRTIIAGSRDITDRDLILQAIRARPADWHISSVISGEARGVDRTARDLAVSFGVPVVRMPANWDMHGREAGYIRNKEMAEVADGLIAIWDGHSRGTASMIQIAEEKNLRVFVFKIPTAQ